MKTLEKLFAEKLLKIKAIKLQPANPFYLGLRLEVAFLL